ncbi:MAG: phosphate ABC transporter permease subunit PstC [Pirellula sp.]|jgi:phosphate transport system permease protein
MSQLPSTQGDLELSELAIPNADRFWDSAFRRICWLAAGSMIVLMLVMLYEIAYKASPAIREYGFGFITSSTWDASREQYGILPEIWGTIYSSLMALVLAVMLGLCIAIWLTQQLLPERLEWALKTVIELLASIPSVVFGLWGIFVVIPMIRPIAGWLSENFSWIPFFRSPLSGPGLFPASLVLAIMVLPTITAISRDAIASVPNRLRDAAFGLGATRWEVITKVVLPTASRGIWGAVVLGLGRALGETMALAMLVGNSNQLTIAIFSPANTLAALLANQFPEASEQQGPVLLYVALVLMMITLGVNVLGSLVLYGLPTKRKMELAA